jgi:hypothetical protein
VIRAAGLLDSSSAGSYKAEASASAVPLFLLTSRLGFSRLHLSRIFLPMKITGPQTPDEYFQRTEHAVRHAYAGIEVCWSIYEATQQKLWGRELGYELGKAQFSTAIFAGSILQVAYTAIRAFSQNSSVPANCATLVERPNNTVVKFCIGKERNTVPIGLIIYAGRHQYAHWGEEEEPTNPVVVKVFDALTIAFLKNSWSDLAFDVGNPTIPVYSGEILLTALKWSSYDKYLGDMKELPLSPL